MTDSTVMWKIRDDIYNFFFYLCHIWKNSVLTYSDSDIPGKRNERNEDD